MKSLKTLKLVLISLLGIMLLAGCGSSKQEWAYIHEPGVTILTLSDNGKAEFKGEKYTYTLENDYLTLTDKDGNELGMRFVPDGEDRMFLYEPAVYEYTGEGQPNGLIGFWQEVDGNLSFEFTDKGTFREDYYSPGYYVVDEENGVIQLIYNDM